RIGQKLVIPGMSAPPPAVAANSAPPRANPLAGNAPRPAEQPRMAAVDTPRAHVSTPAERSIESETETPGEIASGTPSFRWPVRGRIIAGFGARSGNPQNDGINLAVPEGTSVKAAEEG